MIISSRTPSCDHPGTDASPSIPGAHRVSRGSARRRINQVRMVGRKISSFSRKTTVVIPAKRQSRAAAGGIEQRPGGMKSAAMPITYWATTGPCYAMDRPTDPGRPSLRSVAWDDDVIGFIHVRHRRGADKTHRILGSSPRMTKGWADSPNRQALVICLKPASVRHPRA